MVACPSPMIELMGDLVSTLDPDRTQTRYMEIGPVSWWLRNIFSCPTMAHLTLGGKASTDYALRNIAVRVTNLPIYSKSTNRRGLKFIEMKMRMSILTPQLLRLEPAYAQCRYRARNSWSEGSSGSTHQGVLVSFKGIP